MTSSEIKNEIKSYLMITFGIVIYAVGVLGFLVPHKVVGGGATGLATVIYYLTGEAIGVGYSVTAINAILLLIAVKVIGPKFGVKTIYGIIVLSTSLTALQPFITEAIVVDKFMSIVISGILIGVSISLALSAGGSTGGTDIVLMIIRKYRNISAGRLLMYIDSVVILSAMLIGAGIEQLMYGFVVMGVSAFTIDFILIGKKQSAQLFIFTKEYEKVADRVSTEIRRGVTVMDAVGWYSKEGKKVLFVVVPKRDATNVLRIVKQVDPQAFMTMNSVMGVYGEGFEEVQEIK